MNETCQNPQLCCYVAGAIGFVVGVVVTCVVCKIRGCKCSGKGSASAPASARKEAQRAEQRFEKKQI